MRKTCPIVLPEQNFSHHNHTVQSAVKMPKTRSIESQPLFLNNQNAKASANEYITANTSTNTMPNNMHSLSTIALQDSEDDDDDDDNEKNYCFDRTIQATPISTTNNQMPSTSIDDRIDCSSDSTVKPMTELNSLNNEFFNSILTHQQQQQQQRFYPSQATTAITIEPLMQRLSNDSNCTAEDVDNESSSRNTIESNRPRQMGRRSEMRSRIVSITAERSAEGNQVNFIIVIVTWIFVYLKLSLFSSTQRIIVSCDGSANVQNVVCAPCSTPTAIQSNSCVQPSTAILNSGLRTTSQRLSNQSRQFTVSEPSSGCSSRNPSPVSLASSSESSSTDGGCQQMVATTTSVTSDSNIRYV